MKHTAYIVASLALPAITFAQEGLQGTLGTVGDLMSTAVALLFALAVLGFFWGLALYIFKAGEDKAKGINIMIMGTIALFVMASIYGLIGLLSDTFELGDNQQITLPGVPTSGGSSGSGGYVTPNSGAQ